MFKVCGILYHHPKVYSSVSLMLQDVCADAQKNIFSLPLLPKTQTTHSNYTLHTTHHRSTGCFIQMYRLIPPPPRYIQIFCFLLHRGNVSHAHAQTHLSFTEHDLHTIYTVEPPNRGHFGANSFVPCREVVLISEVK